MKKYSIDGRTITVRKNSFAHRFIEHGIPWAVLGSVLGVIAIIYGLSIMWAGILS